MKNLIDKYIKRIKVDYPEDDKLMIDLEDFAKEIKEQLLIQRVVKSFYCDCDTPKPLKRDMYDKTHCNFCRKEIEQ